MNNKNELSDSENSIFITPRYPKPNQKKWKPSELEATVLKMHFRSNQFPTNDEKEAIIKTLDVEFHSQVKLVQLTRWFKNEREKTCAKNSKGAPTHIYRKFEKEELDYLIRSFSEDNYPKLATMTEMAKQMHCSLSKIENWYKHNRRVMAKQGSLKLKTKKYFKKAELNYLTGLFSANSCPNRMQMQEIAGKLNCDHYQIKNWYSNRRKKFRVSDKKNNPESIEPMLEILEDACSFVHSESQTDSKISQGSNEASQFLNMNTPIIQSSYFINETSSLQDLSKLSMNIIRPNAPDIFYRNTMLFEKNLQEMTGINQTAILNNMLSIVHSNTQSHYSNLSNPNNTCMAPKSNPFWPQVQQNMYSNANQIHPLLNGEVLQSQLVFQNWSNMYAPYHNKLQDAALNGHLTNLTQQNKSLNFIVNPVQFVVVVDPHQQHVINNNLIYPK